MVIGMMVIACWAGCLAVGLNYDINWLSAWPYLLILVQTHLYTGLFITAHDAMHGSVSNRKAMNTLYGWVCATLFAFNWYPRLYRKHHLHHAHPVTEGDPDYHHGHFWGWYLRFLLQYVTWWQILLMAISFNLLILIFPETNVIVFWMLPSVLSTLQLFYFGTYRPHRGEHEPGNPHKARSQRRQHVIAFLTCYFFGYHYEHHAHPGTPWWKLPFKKLN